MMSSQVQTTLFKAMLETHNHYLSIPNPKNAFQGNVGNAFQGNVGSTSSLSFHRYGACIWRLGFNIKKLGKIMKAHLG